MAPAPSARDPEPPMKPASVPFSSATKQLLRATVMDALDSLAGSRPWADVTMSQVARAAGVSRQTLYNEFGNRDGLVAAYVMWAADQFLVSISAVVRLHADDLSVALVAAYRHFLESAADHPLVRALEASTGAEGLHSLVASSAGVPVLQTAVASLGAEVRALWPELDGQLVDDAIEVLVRLAISQITVPWGSVDAATRRVELVFRPFLQRISPR